MSQSGHPHIRLYDYQKLNTNSIFQRITLDVEGQHLHDWFLNEDDEPGEAWRWIQT